MRGQTYFCVAMKVEAVERYCYVSKSQSKNTQRKKKCKN